jgi:hypothetical protein
VHHAQTTNIWTAGGFGPWITCYKKKSLIKRKHIIMENIGFIVSAEDTPQI